MNLSDQMTESSLLDLEKKIKTEYARAYIEMRNKCERFFNEQYETIYNHEYEAWKRGEYTDQQFKDWQMNYIARGEKFEKMRDDLAKEYVRADQRASAYINDRTPSIYSLNQNYQAYLIGKDRNDVAWNLADAQTLKNLMMEDRNNVEFKTTSINPKRDYAWNKKQIQSALTSAILQGKNLNELKDSFMVVMKRNQNSAIRNARTSYTSAQNCGRIEAMKQAEEQGIKVQKMWESAGDGRVRDSHAFLDGQIRDIDKKFDNGLMYPADPDGAPCEVYNCRCTMTYIYPKYDKDKSKEAYSESKADGESYQEWLNRQKTKITASR